MRPEVNLNLPQGGLRPIAGPVDTFYAPKIPKSGDMVTNDWLQAASAFKVLAPSISGFLQDLEKDKRKKIPLDAEAAAAGFTGDIGTLSKLPTMSREEASAWLEANQQNFKVPLTNASRPDFVLQFQNFAGRRWAKEAKVATDANGNPATYRDALWSRRDELSNPDADIDGELKKMRDQLFEGVDLAKGQQWRIGVLDSLTPVESEFRQVAFHSQQKLRGDMQSRAVEQELFEGMMQWRKSSHTAQPEPAVAGETALESAERQARNEAIIAEAALSEATFKADMKAVFEGHALVGGKDRNTILSNVIERFAREVQDDNNDGLEVTDFLMWVEDQVFEGDKPLGASGFWSEKLSEIADAMYTRGQRMGLESHMTSEQASNVITSAFRAALREGGARTLEEGIQMLTEDTELQEEMKGLLASNKISTALIPSLIESAASTNERTSASTAISSAGVEMREDLYRRLALEGFNTALEAEVLDEETITALGGSSPGSEWSKLHKAMQDAKDSGESTSDHATNTALLRNGIVSKAELSGYAPSEQNEFFKMQDEIVSTYEDQLRAEPDREKRDDLRKTLIPKLIAEYRAKTAFTDLQSKAYMNDGSLFLASPEAQSLRTNLDAIARAFLPGKEQGTDEFGSPIYVDNPANIALRATATAEMNMAMAEDVETLMTAYKDLPSTKKRNNAVIMGLMRGDATHGVPSLSSRTQKFFGREAGETPATDVDGKQVAPDALAAHLAGERLIGQTTQRGNYTDQDVDRMGLVAVEGLGDDAKGWVSSGRNILLNKGNPDLYKTAMTEHFGAEAEYVYAGPGSGSIATTRVNERPSRNRVLVAVSAALLQDGTRKQPTHWWDNGDDIADVAHDLRDLPPKALKNIQRGALINRGISFAELEAGQTREGVKLSDLWEDLSSVNFEHIGPNDPADFEEAFGAWADESTRADSQYQSVMISLGVFPDEEMLNVPPKRDGSQPTQGEYFMERLRVNYMKRKEALGGEGLMRIDRPYSAIERFSTDTGDAREFAPWQSFVLEQEAAFLNR
ncbi:MAG: hypothetical protein Unbinned5784contig1000_32 [Prokaryotic dsDNA virus sp.]|nr:MAG: hypothetical protein Unbinned5784contig1000_32 [Prokaryotic dsDNA virus sp.]|tara:strand:+ start:3882 stop:6974 length:3093 start_codon:yes stop_codon:yes gene_type:complete